MNTADTIGCENVDPEEIIRRLKRLLELYDKAIERTANNEKELSDTSIS